MINDLQELAASLRYMTRWADALEIMRQNAQEGDTILLPTLSAGPLSEIRRVLAEANCFVNTLDEKGV